MIELRATMVTKKRSFILLLSLLVCDIVLDIVPERLEGERMALGIILEAFWGRVHTTYTTYIYREHTSVMVT